MKRFFGMNSGVFKFMGVLLELAEIGILFLICSIPIVTIGASYAAMQESLYQMHVHGEGCFTAKQFLRTFKSSLKPLVPTWCICLLCFAGLGLNIRFVLANMSGSMRLILCGIYIVLFLLIFGILQYISIFVVLTGKWNRDYLKNSFLMALAKFPTVILVTVMTASVLTIFMLPGSWLLRLFPLVLLFWFSCPAYVCVSLLTRSLEPLFPELFEDEESEK